jgi:hypothetical protein
MQCCTAVRLCKCSAAQRCVCANAVLHICASAVLHICASAVLHNCASAVLHICASAVLHNCASAVLHSGASEVLQSGASQSVYIKTFLKSRQIGTLLSAVLHCAPLSVLTGDGCTDRLYETGWTPVCFSQHLTTLAIHPSRHQRVPVDFGNVLLFALRFSPTFHTLSPSFS